MKNFIIFSFRVLLLLSVTAIFFNSCQTAPQKKNMEPLINAYVNVWNTGNVNALDTLAAKNFELRIDPTFTPILGIDSLKKSITITRRMFPDFKVNIDKKILTGDTVLLGTWTITGTYSKNLKSSIAGKKISVPGFSVIFFSGDKITGEWIAYSDLTMMGQLGFRIVPLEEHKK